MYTSLKETVTKPSFIGKCFNGKYIVDIADDFSYIDPVDGSKSVNQVFSILIFIGPSNSIQGQFEDYF